MRFLDALLPPPRRLFARFWWPKAPQSDLFVSFLRIFRGPGAHARTVLSLQRELDLEGSGGSENRRFFDGFLDGPPDATRETFSRIFRDLGNPK